MGRMVELLRVFVASPSDVDEERLALENVVAEVNRSLADQYGVRLDLIRSETHTYPGFGADAQDVINPQIPNDYDIFVGIMWTRFGTPTHRAGSGTEEEFYRALSMLKENPDHVQIMMYFKDAQIEPSKVDTNQLAHVHEFKRKIESLGAYTWTFKDTAEFVRDARLHLSLYLQHCRRPVERGVPTHARKLSESGLPHLSEDDFGLLDYLELFEDSMSRLKRFANNSSVILNSFTGRWKSRTQDLLDSKNPDGSVNVKDGKKIISKASQDLNDLTINLERELSNFSVNSRSAVDAFQGALQVAGDFKRPTEKEKDYLLEQVKSVILTLKSTATVISAFREIIETMPRTTSEFNRARRNAGFILDEMMEQFDKASSLFSELIDPIHRL